MSVAQICQTQGLSTENPNLLAATESVLTSAFLALVESDDPSSLHQAQGWKDLVQRQKGHKLIMLGLNFIVEAKAVFLNEERMEFLQKKFNNLELFAQRQLKQRPFLPQEAIFYEKVKSKVISDLLTLRKIYSNLLLGHTLEVQEMMRPLISHENYGATKENGQKGVCLPKLPQKEIQQEIIQERRSEPMDNQESLSMDIEDNFSTINISSSNSVSDGESNILEGAYNSFWSPVLTPRQEIYLFDSSRRVFIEQKQESQGHRMELDLVGFDQILKIGVKIDDNKGDFRSQMKDLTFEELPEFKCPLMLCQQQFCHH